MERKTTNYIRNTTEKILISAATDKLSWTINKLCPATMKKSPSVYFYCPIMEQLSRRLHLICEALHKIRANCSSEEQLIIPNTATTNKKASSLSFFSINYPVFTSKPINNKHKLLFRRETMNKISASPNLIRANCSLEEQFDCIKRENSRIFNIYLTD